MLISKASPDKFEQPRPISYLIDGRNKRVKITDFNGYINQVELENIHNLAIAKGCEKIIVTAGEVNWRSYQALNYILEGTIDYFFRGQRAYILSFFLKKERQLNPFQTEEDKILKQTINCGSEEEKEKKQALPWTIRDAKPEDAEKLSEIFQEVFLTYPTPLHDPLYIREVMQKNVHFKVCLLEEEIVSIASAEIDREYMNAEMTDCATLPKYRGLRLMEILIRELEKEMKKQGITTVYSLARAKSLGITKVFRKQGYQYRGRLVNNCHICGEYESMNIWVKVLD